MSKKNSLKNKQIRREERNMKEEQAEAFGFMQKINQILAKIRESDTGMMQTTENNDPDKHVITKVLFPPEGGVFTHFEKMDHPCKGFCYGETVETVDEVKKTMMAFLTGFFDSISKSKIRTLLFAILFRKQFEFMAKRLLVQLDYRMRRVRQKPERYCVCAREFYRTFNKMAIWYPELEKEINSFRNIWCMMLEYDDAYRYTFQDVLVNLDKDVARKDIVKELKRILDLILERDDRGLFVKFSQIRKLLFLLNFDKKLKQAMTRFFLELDIDKIKMDEDDKYHANFKQDYNWNHEENFREKQAQKKVERAELLRAEAEREKAKEIQN